MEDNNFKIIDENWIDNLLTILNEQREVEPDNSFQTYLSGKIKMLSIIKEDLQTQQSNLKNINRLEIINHFSTTSECTVGRVFTNYSIKSCELNFQDNNKTLKIFI